MDQHSNQSLEVSHNTSSESARNHFNSCPTHWPNRKIRFSDVPSYIYNRYDAEVHLWRVESWLKRGLVEKRTGIRRYLHNHLIDNPRRTYDRYGRKRIKAIDSDDLHSFLVACQPIGSVESQGPTGPIQTEAPRIHTEHNTMRIVDNTLPATLDITKLKALPAGTVLACEDAQSRHYGMLVDHGTGVILIDLQNGRPVNLDRITNVTVVSVTLTVDSEIGATK